MSYINNPYSISNIKQYCSSSPKKPSSSLARAFATEPQNNQTNYYHGNHHHQVNPFQQQQQKTSMSVSQSGARQSKDITSVELHFESFNMENEEQQQETTTTTVREQQQQPIVVPPLPRRNQTIPLRARVTSAVVQQHLPASNKIRTVDACNHIVQSFNNNGIFTKNDLAAFAHNHNNNDDVNDEFSTLATELQRNVE